MRILTGLTSQLRRIKFFCLAVSSSLLFSDTLLANRADQVTLLILAPEMPGSSEVGGRGRDIELVQASLDACGWQARFEYQPFGRHLRSYQDHAYADAVMTVPLSFSTSGYSTAAYIWYHYGALYNASALGAVTSINDLVGSRAVTFKNGIEILGLTNQVDNFGLLIEVSNQTIHARMQLMGRVDVILADGLITATLHRRVRNERRINKAWPLALDDFTFFPLFHPMPYKMMFRDQNRATQFDDCFDRIRADGQVVEINSRYIGQYEDILLNRYLGR